MVESVSRDYAPLARCLLVAALLIAGLAATGWWAWQQPFMAPTRMLWEISRMPAPASLPMPVRGVTVAEVADTWGAERGGDRRHEGVDIFATRGTAVTSTTRGVVGAVREGGLGGRQVWVRGPGLENHYYAHLDGWAEHLSQGDVVLPGDVLGFVGDSGNARGTPTHLHYGIYGDDGALDPMPRLRAGSAPAASASR